MMAPIKSEKLQGKAVKNTSSHKDYYSGALCPPWECLHNQSSHMCVRLEFKLRALRGTLGLSSIAHMQARWCSCVKVRLHGCEGSLTNQAQGWRCQGV